jgi:hypothetical protein
VGKVAPVLFVIVKRSGNAYSRTILNITTFADVPLDTAPRYRSPDAESSKSTPSDPMTVSVIDAVELAVIDPSLTVITAFIN